MKKVYWVKGHELEEHQYFSGMDIFSGDVYGFDDPETGIIWIWVGSKSSVEESTVAAWFMNKIDQERDGLPDIVTIEEGEEPMLFNETWSFNVIDDDTPGFLKEAELDYVEYKLFRVYTEQETLELDEATVQQVPISRNSLTSDDVYVLDGNGGIYCWIGRTANIEEKRMGQQIMQQIDAERNYLPIQYTVYEGDDDKSEHAFYELLDKLEKLAPEDRSEVSIEDQRELNYVPEEAKSVDEHKEEVDEKFEDSQPENIPAKEVTAGSDEHQQMIDDSKITPNEIITSKQHTEGIEHGEDLNDQPSIPDPISEAPTSNIETTSPDDKPAITEADSVSDEQNDYSSTEIEETNLTTPENEVNEQTRTIKDEINEEELEKDKLSDSIAEKPELMNEPHKDEQSEAVVTEKVDEVTSPLQAEPSAKTVQPPQHDMQIPARDKKNSDRSMGFGGAPEPELSDLSEGPPKDGETKPVVEKPSQMPPNYEPKQFEQNEPISSNGGSPDQAKTEPKKITPAPIPELEDESSSDEMVKPAKRKTVPIPDGSPDSLDQSTEQKTVPTKEPVSQPKALTNNKVHADCVAVRSHATIWRGGNSCGICGMVEKDCPNHEEHWDQWHDGQACSICKAKP